MVRDLAQRAAHARSALERGVDAWVATASASGRPHLVPLSFAMDGPTMLLATVARSATAKNLAATGRARLGVGDTRDVVMVDATATVTPWGTADQRRRDAFVAARGWDPSSEPDEFVLVALVPVRIQVWDSVEEIAGRTVLADGVWLDAGPGAAGDATG